MCRASSPRSTAIPTAAPSRPRAAPCRCCTSTTSPSASALPATRRSARAHRGAIARVLEMQDSSGAFGIWGPSDGDMWLTSYVTDFLTRAKEPNYAVRQQSFNQALDRLPNYISYAQDFERGGEARAYALYVLARNGRAPIGELRYYVDTKLDDFATPLAQAQLGAALAMMGDRPRAERALQAAFKRRHGQGRRRHAPRLRHRHARWRGADHAGVGDRRRQARGAAHDRAGRQGLRGQDLHLHAGAGLDAAGGAGAGRGGQEHDAHRQRPAAPGPADAVASRRRICKAADQDRQHGRQRRSTRWCRCSARR